MTVELWSMTIYSLTHVKERVSGVMWSESVIYRLTYVVTAEKVPANVSPRGPLGALTN